MNPDQAISRRHFLAAAAAGAGGLALGGPVMGSVRGAAARRPPIALDGAFRQSVASGQPATDGITLWTRVEDLDRTSRLQVEIAKDADFGRVVHRQTVQAESSRDYTVHHRVKNARELAAGEQYYYRFFTCNESSAVGRFKTARPADSRQPVRIGFFSCQNYAAGYYTAHQGLLNEPDLDLVVCLGDYIYEQTGEDSIPARLDRTGANRDSEVQTLPEYRDKYRLYHGDADLQALRARYPMLAIWDDHESENDNAGSRPSPSRGQQNTKSRRLPYGERRGMAYRAFFEHMPRMVVPGDVNRIYGTVPLGANVDLLLLDERQYRDQQPCGGETGRPCSSAEANAPGRTLLGSTQKAWLKRELESSRATWKVVANQVMIMALDVPARVTVNPDQWDGYGAERRELLEFIQARGIKDVSFVTGDIHTFFAGNVTPSGREGVPAVDGTPAATEFVAGAITSKGLEETLPAEGPVAGPTTEAGVRANNPHIVQADLARRGYAVLEARPNELRVNFRAVRTALAPRSAVDTIASFRVPRGTARVERIS